APSAFLAKHFLSKFGIHVEVIRPPLASPSLPIAAPVFDLPPRYFLHFGQLMRRKGTAQIAEALPLAWREEPDITMVWSGACWNPSELKAWRSRFGAHAHKVIYTGPLDRSTIAYLVQKADAAVLPSEVDNLPNTVIESLAQGIPVIGTRNSSI